MGGEAKREEGGGDVGFSGVEEERGSLFIEFERGIRLRGKSERGEYDEEDMLRRPEG